MGRSAPTASGGTGWQVRLVPWIVTIWLGATGATGYAQDLSSAAPDTARVRVFVDCPDYGIDPDYLKREVAFVDYVRDRADADVHLLATTRQTGAGGTEYTLAFIGLRRFAGPAGALTFVTSPTQTEDEIRQTFVRYCRIGLVPFVSRTPAVERLDVTWPPPGTGEQPTPARDPWDHWTFRTSVSTSLNGEKTYKYRSLYGWLSADRVTEAWKLGVSVLLSDSRSDYDYGEALEYSTTQRSHEETVSAVRSLTPHWSLGVRTTARRSTYSNCDLLASLGPGIEYSLFPYSESTRRQVTLAYLLTASHYDYHEETVYLKMAESRASQRVNIAGVAKQPWGSVYASLNGSHFVDDLAKYNVRVNSSLDLRIVRGLSLSLYGYLTFQRDQISLPRGGATIEEVLLRRQELETSYYYYGNLGLTYTFGSIYSSIVNPRFGGL